MTWPSIEASRMHMQAVSVLEQAWIFHKRCSIGEDKPRLRSDEATKSG